MVGLIVTVKGADDVHFYSRFFAPWLGVNEDPVKNFNTDGKSLATFSNRLFIRYADLLTVL